MSPSSSILQSVYSWRDLQQGRFWSRTRGVLALKSETVTNKTGIQTRASNLFPSAVSHALTPLGGGLLARARGCGIGGARGGEETSEGNEMNDLNQLIRHHEGADYYDQGTPAPWWVGPLLYGCALIVPSAIAAGYWLVG